MFEKLRVMILTFAEIFGDILSPPPPLPAPLLVTSNSLENQIKTSPVNHEQ